MQFRASDCFFRYGFEKSKIVKIEDKTEQQIKTLLLKISYLTLNINTVEWGTNIVALKIFNIACIGSGTYLDSTRREPDSTFSK